MAGEVGSRLPDFVVKEFLEDATFFRRPPRQGRARGLLGYLVPAVQERDAWLPKTPRPVCLPQGFVVIGFKFDTMADIEDPVRFARKMGVHYPLAVASDDLKLRFGGIEGLPTTMLYDRHGILRKKVIGFEYTDSFENDLTPLF